MVERHLIRDYYRGDFYYDEWVMLLKSIQKMRKRNNIIIVVIKIDGEIKSQRLKIE